MHNQDDQLWTSHVADKIDFQGTELLPRPGIYTYEAGKDVPEGPAVAIAREAVQTAGDARVIAPRRAAVTANDARSPGGLSLPVNSRRWTSPFYNERATRGEPDDV